MESQSGLTIVGRFSYIHEADLAKGLLDSEGVECWLLDEHQIRHRWHLGNALGGVKLAVAPESAERALELLGQDFSQALTDIPEQELPGHLGQTCARCGATASGEPAQQTLPGPLQWAESLFFLLVGGLVPRRRFQTRWHCHSCGHNWSQVESR